MAINYGSMEMKQREPDISRVNNLVSTINGKPIKEVSFMEFNQKWQLAITSNGSRYWIHPESGKVLTIKEVLARE